MKVLRIDLPQSAIVCADVMIGRIGRKALVTKKAIQPDAHAALWPIADVALPLLMAVYRGTSTVLVGGMAFGSAGFRNPEGSQAGHQRAPCIAVLWRHHTTGDDFINTASVICAGCRPLRMVSIMSGASSVSRSTRPT